ncbi:MAG: ABC transporter permease subunit [Clostridiales Family XIII bacterium]|jgi:phosphate transport system permease protein|nr:ABC transporter permease subunit [Clostridiales Family XIII bacterium]
MRFRERRAASALGEAYSWVAMAMIAAVCLLILLTVFVVGKDAFSLKFLTSEPNPSAMGADAGGISTPIIGTVLLTLIGIGVAFPLSLATAIYTTYYQGRGPIGRCVNLAIDILSGVPTIVIALFALAIFTNPALALLSTPVQNDGGAIEKAYGRSFLVAGVTMAIMILPSVVKAMAEALHAVPAAYLDGSLALGADKWRTVCKVALPSARRGLVTGAILGMGRIMGDTAIVWLALGGTLRMTGRQPWFLPSNWLDTLRNTGGTLTSYIYYASPAGEGDNLRVAFGASLALILIIIALNAAAAFLGGAGRTEDE